MNEENNDEKGEHINEPEDREVLFGWRNVRPKFLQVFRKPLLFTFALLTCIGPQVIVSFMLPHVKRTLGRRFKLSEKEGNVLVAVQAISAMISAIVMGYIGNSRNKIRWIAAGMAMTALGAILFAMPHYDIGKYSPTDVPPWMMRYFGLCMASMIPCSEGTVGKSQMALFVIGQIFIGAGMGPLYTLIPSYIDENVNPESMPLHMFLYYTNLFIGPVIAMLISNAFLNGVYIDVKQPDLLLQLTRKDLRWIGAWWLGYFIAGILLIFNTIIILGFPQRLPGSRAKRIEGMQKGIIQRNDPKIKRTAFGVLYATKCLLKNKVFLFNTLAVSCIALLFYAMGPFLFYVIMIKYGADPSEIGVAFGLVLLLGFLVGFAVGAYLTKRVGIKTIVKGAAFVCLITEAICILIPLLFVIPGCSDSNIAGVSVPYPPLGKTAMVKQKGTSELTTACNARCLCNTVLNRPICGSNNVAYFDACHAGCLAKPSEETFANCTCIPPTKPGHLGGDAKLGFCDRNCKSWGLFLFAMFIALVIFAANFVPNKAVVLRCVPYNQRSYALGLQAFMFTLVALIPGHLIRFIMDRDCNIWQTDPCGRKGFCLDYKADSMTKSMAIFGLLVTALSVVFYFLSWYCCDSSEQQSNNNQLLNSNGIEDGADNETDL